MICNKCESTLMSERLAAQISIMDGSQMSYVDVYQCRSCGRFTVASAGKVLESGLESSVWNIIQRYTKI